MKKVKKIVNIIQKSNKAKNRFLDKVKGKHKNEEENHHHDHDDDELDDHNNSCNWSYA